MATVLIDGVEYAPKTEIPTLNDERLQSVLEVLTEMRYHNRHHKMKALAWNAINEISPELARLDEATAYELIHGAED